MKIVRRHSWIRTNVACAPYVREGLMQLGVKYDIRLAAPDRLEYHADLTSDERKYLCDYMDQLQKIGVNPIL